jgi:hypothetical protein
MRHDDMDEDDDDLDLPPSELDAVSTGAAADSADWREELQGLPRLARYALLVTEGAEHLEQRLIAEIAELCPELPQNAAWATALDLKTGLALAAELDHRAATDNDPNLRGVSDCVRLLCLPAPRNATNFEDHRRVGKALLRTLPGQAAALLRSRELHLRLGSAAGLHRPAVAGRQGLLECGLPRQAHRRAPHCRCQASRFPAGPEGGTAQNEPRGQGAASTEFR